MEYALPRLIVISIWVTTFLAPNALFSQVNNFYGTASTTAPGGAAFDEAFKKGIAALNTRNTAGASQLFQTALNDASSRKDKEAKSRARAAGKRVMALYEPYFAAMEEGADFQRQLELKAAQLKFEEAQELMNQYAITGDPAFEELDSRLTAQADQQQSLVQQQRIQEFNNRYQAGEQRLNSRDFEGTLREMEAASALLIETQDAAQMERVNKITNQAQYQQLILKGDQAALTQNFEEALASYSEAQGIYDAYEVQQKIQEISKNSHFQTLQKAQESFNQGEYQMALDQLNQANEYTSSDYSMKFQDNAQSALREKGKASARAGQFDEALELMTMAANFKDDAQVRSEIEQVKNLVKHDKSYSKALELMDKEKLRSAQKKLKAASRRDNTPAVDELIRKIDAYYLHIDEGQHALRMEKSEDALKFFKEAEKLFPTSEVRRLIAKVEGATKGTITDDDLY